MLQLEPALNTTPSTPTDPDLDAEVRAVVDQAPPLTATQRAVIGNALRRPAA